MRCPKCGRQDDKVIDSRASREGATIRRLKKAFQKRPISPQVIEELLEKIVNEITDKYDREVPGSDIGERVMAGLRDIDDVAYVRFASVYRRFQEATDFVHEVKKLEEKPS